jgi:parallel beta-helix repeat protein
MTRIVRLVLGLVFLCSSLFALPLAATVDVFVFSDLPRQAAVGSVLTWTLFIDNEGPDSAPDVMVSTTAPGLEPSTPCGPVMHFASLDPHSIHTIACSARLPLTTGDVVISSIATTTAVDSRPGNNGFDFTLNVTDATFLQMYLSAPIALDAALPFVYTVYYLDRSPIAATGAIIDITLPAGVSYRSGPDFCSAAGGNVTCRIGNIPAGPNGEGDFSSFQFNAVAPDVTQEQVLTTTALIHADQPDLDLARTYSMKTPLFRTFRVTTTADSGSGSLREAINSANASCTDQYPCKIAFAIPAPPIDGVQTIHPETPLPHLQGTNLIVDGGMQSTLFGDSNPAGPEVQLLGDRLPDGDGLVIETSCFSQIQGLTISGFPGTGIVVLDDRCDPPQLSYYNTPSEDFSTLPRMIVGNYLGTDPTGSRAVPNLRGLVSAGTQVSPIRIDGNLISGNRRSGIFLASGRASLIVGNTIGLDPSRKVPLGNGASGIYIGPDAYATDVSRNMIAFNHDSGISVAASAVEISSNSIFANDQLAIDLGLDGPTAPTDSLGGALLTSAHYDPTTGLTTIEGSVIGGVGVFSSIVDLFANDALDPSGYGEAQYTLGGTTTGSDRRHFAFSYPGDLRGKFITATVTRNDYFGFARVARLSPDSSWQGFVTTTSEVSKAIPVD